MIRFFLRELMVDSYIISHHVPSNNQLAGILTEFLDTHYVAKIFKFPIYMTRDLHKW